MEKLTPLSKNYTVKVYWHLSGTCRLRLQGTRIQRQAFLRHIGTPPYIQYTESHIPEYNTGCRSSCSWSCGTADAHFSHPALPYHPILTSVWNTVWRLLWAGYTAWRYWAAGWVSALWSGTVSMLHRVCNVHRDANTTDLTTSINYFMLCHPWEANSRLAASEKPQFCGKLRFFNVFERVQGVALLGPGIWNR